MRRGRNQLRARRSTPYPHSMEEVLPPQEGDHTLADPSSFAMDLTELTVETAEGSADVSLLVDGVSIASTTADATGTTVALDDSVSAGSTVELNVSNATSLGEITTSLLWS